MAEEESLEKDDEVEDITEEDEENPEGGEESEGESKSKSKLPLIVGAVVGVLLLGGVGSYFMGFFGGGGTQTVAKGEGEEEDLLNAEITYYDFPQILVNLNEPGRKGKFLKLSIVLELASPDDVSLIDKLEPRIIDQFQMYLRELRFEDLQGSEGVYRLREELLRRVNSEVGKNKVRDVLFKNILVQ